jgi:DNA-binding NtrC family response regulator
LRGTVPRELVRLLSLVNINPFAAGGLDADLVAAFARGTRGGWSVSVRTGAAAVTTDSGFMCDNAYVAATFLLSRALGLREPFLVANEETFATVRRAIALAPGSANVLIEGEAGVGKRSLAILLDRVGARGELARVDCAVPEEVARELATIARGRLDTVERPRGTVLLDHLAELPRAHQLALAREVAAQPHAVRYLATAKGSIAGLIDKGAFAPAFGALFSETLRLPPMRRRLADLAALAGHFLRNANPLLQLDASALAALRDYPFPGNVRELQSLMTRLEIYETGEHVRSIDSARVLRQLEPPLAPQAATHTPPPDARAARSHLRLVQPLRAKRAARTMPAMLHLIC